MVFSASSLFGNYENDKDSLYSPFLHFSRPFFSAHAAKSEHAYYKKFSIVLRVVKLEDI